MSKSSELGPEFKEFAPSEKEQKETLEQPDRASQTGEVPTTDEARSEALAVEEGEVEAEKQAGVSTAEELSKPDVDRLLNEVQAKGEKPSLDLQEMRLVEEAVEKLNQMLRDGTQQE